ncbi:MAG: ATP-binding protein [Cyclobacteriaceae bacterium]|nr:ATP-binding protein [Cyclobacteriaceae bacterium]
MIRIAITGPESTGKSTFVRKLAEHYKTVWVPEFARIYINQLDRPYEQHDLAEIAKGQISHERELISKANKYLFCDTELTVIKIWSEYKYGTVDPYILSEYYKMSYDLYLLMDIDFPWEYDPQREHPEKRKFFFDWFESELKAKKAHYRVISGNHIERIERACVEIDNTLFKRANRE